MRSDNLMSMQLAQRDDPVEETKLEDENVGQGAANTSDSKSFDKGHIAPEPGMLTTAADGEQQQNEVDVEFSLMQPVYSSEYTESVKPKHIVPEKVRWQNFNHVVPEEVTEAEVESIRVCCVNVMVMCV